MLKKLKPQACRRLGPLRLAVWGALGGLGVLFLFLLWGGGGGVGAQFFWVLGFRVSGFWIKVFVGAHGSGFRGFRVKVFLGFMVLGVWGCFGA